MNGLHLPYEITQVLNAMYRKQTLEADLLQNWDAYFSGLTAWLEQRKAFLLDEEDEALWENAWVAVEDFLALAAENPDVRRLTQAAYDLEDAFQHFYQATQRFCFVELAELDDLLRLGLAFAQGRAGIEQLEPALARARRRVEPMIREFQLRGRYPQEVMQALNGGISEWSRGLQRLEDWNEDDLAGLRQAMRHFKKAAEVLVYLHRWQNANDLLPHLPVSVACARSLMLLGDCPDSLEEVQNQLIPDLWAWWQHQRDRLLIHPELAAQSRQEIDELWEARAGLPVVEWLQLVNQSLGVLKSQSLALEVGYGTGYEVLLVAIHGAFQGCVPDAVLADLAREFKPHHATLVECQKNLRRYLKTRNPDYLYYSLESLLEACLELAEGGQVLRGKLCSCCLTRFDENNPLCWNGKPHSYLELCA